MTADEQKQLEKQVRRDVPGLLNNLPGDKKKQLLDFLQGVRPGTAAALAATQVIHQFTSSPVPPAELLEGYNREIPDGANRLFTLVEKQSAHRQEVEKAVIVTQNKVTKRGQWIALFLVLVLTAVGSYLGFLGHDTLSGTIFATTIVAVATVFIAGRNAQKRSLIQKGG